MANKSDSDTVIVVYLLDLVATNSCSYLILHVLIDIVINLFQNNALHYRVGEMNCFLDVHSMPLPAPL